LAGLVASAVKLCFQRALLSTCFAERNIYSAPPETGRAPDRDWRADFVRAAIGGLRESFAFDVGGPDHFGPFFNFLKDEPAKIGGCHWHGCCS
jgi:hypothetical protein